MFGRCVPRGALVRSSSRIPPRTAVPAPGPMVEPAPPRPSGTPPNLAECARRSRKRHGPGGIWRSGPLSRSSVC
ncbi:hypothetical protein BN2537_9499 [Streptomyces venezuelae]|nr:hypothetical protein BN2537_9499 [Streptomyces venezuelae]